MHSLTILKVGIHVGCSCGAAFFLIGKDEHHKYFCFHFQAS